MKKNDVKNDSRKDNNLMVKIATFIVDKRRAFYLIFALALVLRNINTESAGKQRHKFISSRRNGNKTRTYFNGR